jgi:hypothetical protein
VIGVILVKLNSDAVSELGCSVVSGIVAESIINFDQENKHLFINVLTLYRNFVSCIDGDAETKVRMFKSSSTVNDIIKLFLEDTLIFVSACTENGVKVTIYELDYNSIFKAFGDYKHASEFKGVKYYIATTQDKAAKIIKENMPGVYKKYGRKLEHEKKMFVTTHIGIDLVPLAKYSDVTLIESHTGEFKDRLKFFTKLKKLGKNDMSLIPFNEIMYRVFGDNEYITPANLAIRRAVYANAKLLHWYQGLGNKDVLSGLTRKDASLATTLKKAFRLIF